MFKILHLPFELLSEIAEFTLERHPLEGYVTSSSDLVALSSTAKLFYSLATPILFRDIAITKEEQLAILSQLEPKLLVRCRSVSRKHHYPISPAKFQTILTMHHCRQLSVFLDAELFQSLKFWGYVRRGPGPPELNSPYDALARILSRTKELDTFRVRIAHPTSALSAWCPLFARTPFTIPLTDALTRSKVPFTLKNLRTLELDGFSAFDCLLQAAPNLRRLCLRLSSGFPQSTNTELVRGLKHVPQLRELVYSPTTLRLRRSSFNELDNPDALFWNLAGADEGQTAPSELEEVGAEVRLLRTIGATVPLLESLDLETRRYSGEVAFCASQQILPNNVSLFPKLLCVNQRQQTLRLGILYLNRLSSMRFPPLNDSDTSRCPVRL